VATHVVRLSSYRHSTHSIKNSNLLPITPSESHLSSRDFRTSLLSGGAWALGGRAVHILSVLGLNALLARLLAPGELGVYFLTHSLVLMGATLGLLGMDIAVVRLVAESVGIGNPGRAKASLRIALLVTTVGSFTVAGFLALNGGDWIAHSVFKSPAMGEITVLAALWLLLMTFRRLFAEVFRGFQDIRLATIFEICAVNLISIVLLFLLWMLRKHSNLEQILAIIILSSFITFLVAGALTRKKMQGLKGKDGIKAQEVMAIAWPLLVTNLAVVALSQSDLWILGAFLPKEEVAVYGACRQLMLMIPMSLIVINSVIQPLIAQLYVQGKREEIEGVLRITAAIAAFPAFLVMVVFLLFGGPILGIVFGDYYREGAAVLAVLSLGLAFNVWAGSCGLALMMTGNQAVLMWITIFCGLLTFVGAMLVVKDFGVIGVGTVATSTMVIQNLLMLIFVKIKTGMWTHASFNISSFTKFFRG